MKNIKKTVTLGLITLGLGFAAAGAMANPVQHLRHIDHRENQVVRHDTHAIQRAYNHGNYHRAHRLAHQMDNKVHQLNHERHRVIKHHFF
jgi:isoaspartyl peptidase/L-asparaginase-like protein (Ntn-hydrolase superfamily)